MICNKEGESSIDAQVQEKGRGALSMVLIEVHTKQAKIIKNIYTDPALTFSGFKMAIWFFSFSFPLRFSCAAISSLHVEELHCIWRVEGVTVFWRVEEHVRNLLARSQKKQDLLYKTKAPKIFTKIDGSQDS